MHAIERQRRERSIKHTFNIQHESDQMKKLKRGEELRDDREGSSQFQPSNLIEPRLSSAAAAFYVLCESEKSK